MILKQITVFSVWLLILFGALTCSKIRSYETMDGKYLLEVENTNFKSQVGGCLSRRGVEFQVSLTALTADEIKVDLSNFCATISFFEKCVKPSYLIGFDLDGYPDWSQKIKPYLMPFRIQEERKVLFVFDHTALPIPMDEGILRKFMKSHIVEIHPNQPTLLTSVRWQFRMKGDENDWF